MFLCRLQIVEPAIGGGGVVILELEGAGGAGAGRAEITILWLSFRWQGGDGRGVVGASALHDGFDRAKQIVAQIWRGRLGAGERKEGDNESEGEAESPRGNLIGRVLATGAGIYPSPSARPLTLISPTVRYCAGC